jgi:hypothetical protein
VTAANLRGRLARELARWILGHGIALVAGKTRSTT